LGIHRFTCGEYLLDLKELILGRFLEITGVKVGLKASLWKPFPKPILEDIDEEWQKLNQSAPLNHFRIRTTRFSVRTLKEAQDFCRIIFEINNFLHLRGSQN
jgi:hypothetical protein